MRLNKLHPTNVKLDMIAVTPSGHQYYDARKIHDEEFTRHLMRENLPIRFDWENRWLRGDQYAYMLNNIEAYKTTFGMPRLGNKQHPENIYVKPESKFCSTHQCRWLGVLRPS